MLASLHRRSPNLKGELLSGLTVALALVPEAIAFAFVAGISPVIGLYSAFIIGLVCSVMGGRPGMISGATGAMAVVVVSLVAIHGIEYLFPAVILCGLLQVGVGAARLGVLIRMVPHSVMIGFVNGLAIVICVVQFGSFKTIGDSGQLQWMSGTALAIMVGLVVVTMAIIWLLPKWTKVVPASLAAILLVSLVGFGMNHLLPQRLAAANQSNVVMTVGDMLATNVKLTAAQSVLNDFEDDSVVAAGQTSHAHQAAATHGPLTSEQQAKVSAALAGVSSEQSSIRAGLPQLFFRTFDVPPISWETLRIIFPFSLVLAAVGLIESLMTLSLIDEITDTQGNGNRECLGQGIGNLVCGLFGGMGGCAMIGQSLINVRSGGRERLSGIFAACCLLAFVLFFSSWIEMIPMAALVGVMFMVVIGTFEWASLKLFRKVPMSDCLVMVVVAGYTAIWHDLATAVVIGVVVSALVFAFKHAKNVAADTKLNEFGAKIYQLHGPLFFASTTQFKGLFDVHSDPDVVVIDFYYTRVYDQSAMEAIQAIAEKYQQQGKELHLTHLSDECRDMLEKANDLFNVSISEEPHFHVTKDRIEPLDEDGTSLAISS